MVHFGQVKIKHRQAFGPVFVFNPALKMLPESFLLIIFDTSNQEGNF